MKQDLSIAQQVESKTEPHLGKRLWLVLVACTLVSGLTGFTVGKYWRKEKTDARTDQMISAPLINEYKPENEYDTRGVYKNPRWGYEFEYADDFAPQEIGEEIQGGKKDDCVQVRFSPGNQSSYLTIKSPDGVAGGCIETGVGINAGLSSFKEKVSVSETEYIFDGTRVDHATDQKTIKTINEFLRLVDVPQKGFVIEFGGYYNPGEDEKRYLKEKELVKQILASFRFTGPSGTAKKSKVYPRYTRQVGEKEGLRVETPVPGALITDPLTINGQVKNWMFEGIFQTILVDENRLEVARGHGRDVVPGGWTSGNWTPFEGTMEFKTDAKKGYLIFQVDNQSGLPEHDKGLEMEVRFK